MKPKSMRLGKKHPKQQVYHRLQHGAVHDRLEEVEIVLADLYLYTIELEKRLAPFVATRGYVRFPVGAEELGERVRTAVECPCDPEHDDYKRVCPIHSQLVGQDKEQKIWKANAAQKIKPPLPLPPTPPSYPADHIWPHLPPNSLE